MSIINSNETIYALASGSGKSGIAVFRLSGPKAGDVLASLTNKPLPEPRSAQLVRLFDQETNDLLDECIAIYFVGPNSFTGEDVVELHVHGGRAVPNALINALSRISGIRLAQPGEFTRRAFENDKLDLTAAEGLADLINAETEAQRRQAIRQMRGDLGDIYKGWRERLLGSLALFEAGIDFSDEDLPGDIFEKALYEINNVNAEIIDHLCDDKKGETLREGIHVTIIGPPNAGKSTLLNKLSGRETAIVSEKEGTTRDIIEARIDFAGCPVVFEDTAGLRETKNSIEAEGVKRAQERASQSNFNLVVLDGKVWPNIDDKTAKAIDQNAIVIINKSDLLQLHPKKHIAISALTGDGIEKLMAIIEKKVSALSSTSFSPTITRARHRKALEKCSENLERCIAAKGMELQAEDLRQATRFLGEITGAVGVEEVLDIIFRDFCIGK